MPFNFQGIRDTVSTLLTPAYKLSRFTYNGISDAIDAFTTDPGQCCFSLFGGALVPLFYTTILTTVGKQDVFPNLLKEIGQSLIENDPDYQDCRFYKDGRFSNFQATYPYALVCSKINDGKNTALDLAGSSRIYDIALHKWEFKPLGFSAIPVFLIPAVTCAGLAFYFNVKEIKENIAKGEYKRRAEEKLKNPPMPEPKSELSIANLAVVVLCEYFVISLFAQERDRMVSKLKPGDSALELNQLDFWATYMGVIIGFGSYCSNIGQSTVDALQYLIGKGIDGLRSVYKRCCSSESNLRMNFFTRASATYNKLESEEVKIALTPR